MGCCESCLDLLEMKYFQPNYVKIPEKIIEKVEENHIETKNVLEITIPHEIELIKERTTKSSKTIFIFKLFLNLFSLLFISYLFFRV